MKDTFSPKENIKAPLNFYALTKEELNAEIQKGLDDIKAGRVISAEKAFEDLQKEFKF